MTQEKHERPDATTRDPMRARLNAMRAEGIAAAGAKVRERELALYDHLNTLADYAAFPIQRIRLGSDGIAWACDTLMTADMEQGINAFLTDLGPLSDGR